MALRYRYIREHGIFDERNTEIVKKGDVLDSLDGIAATRHIDFAVFEEGTSSATAAVTEPEPDDEDEPTRRTFVR